MKFGHFLLAASLSVVTCFTSVTFADQQEQYTQAEKQFFVGYQLLGTSVNIFHDYYINTKLCPDSVADIGLPDVSQLKGSPLANITINNKCDVKLTFKADSTIAQELQGKVISVMMGDMTAKKFSGSCSFDGAKGMITTNCKLDDKLKQISFSIPVVRELKDLYKTTGMLPKLQQPMKKVLSTASFYKADLAKYYYKHNTCPNSLNELTTGEIPLGEFVESISVNSQCEIIAQLKSTDELDVALKGKMLTLKMQPTSGAHVFWHCVTNVEEKDSKYIPGYCKP